MSDSSPKPKWPPDYHAEYGRRLQMLQYVSRETDLKERERIIAYYADNLIQWVSDFGVTFDPRRKGAAKIIPFILFPKQAEFLEFLQQCLRDGESGLIEKSRDIGATWLCCMFSLWLWLFHPGSSIGWGSRDEDSVDQRGNPDSIFEKMRLQLERLPAWMLPDGYDPKFHCKFMNIINPENSSSIKGDAGDNIGRGGRSMIYFKDESAHYEHPEKIEASLGDNTDVQIDISSVNGSANIFYRRRMAGEIWTPGSKIAKGVTRVFIFDWRDHPGKTQEWYDARRKKYEAEGLLHVLAQEVDRDYSGSVSQCLIPMPWIQAAIDAHIKLNIEIKGEKMAALDVADEGGDKNALIARHGILLKYAEDWGMGDTGVTANRAVTEALLLGCNELDYDCIGVGAGVKSETNRLAREGKLPATLKILPWDAGSNPENQEHHIIADDVDSPLIKDFFLNRKIQGWWYLRMRFEKTFKMVTQGIVYPHDELISLSSHLPHLHKLCRELNQPVWVKNDAGIMKVDKKPQGALSPNLGDGTMMCYHPMREYGPGLGYLEFLGAQHAKKAAEEAAKPVIVNTRV